jgi:hypothetical protein
MHIDYTFHFWTVLPQFLALIGLCTFLWKVYKGIRSVVRATLVILDQHGEMYAWYGKMKDLPIRQPHGNV